MLYLAGNGIAGYLSHLPFRSLAFRCLEGAVGSSGGSLAVAALCSRDVAGMESCLPKLHSAALVLDVLSLKGTASRLALLQDWVGSVTGDNQATFSHWATSKKRRSFSVLAFDVSACRPVIFDLRSTPEMSVAAALCAASAWPSITDCFESEDGTLLCDVEYVLAPSLLAGFLYPRPVVVVEGTSKTLGRACAGSSAMSKLKTFLEYTGNHGSVLGDRYRVVPTFFLKGPHILDFVLQPVDYLLASYDPHPPPPRDVLPGSAADSADALLCATLASACAVTILEMLTLRGTSPLRKTHVFENSM